MRRAPAGVTVGDFEDSPGCRFHRSHLQLLTGQFDASWAGCEARRKISLLLIIHADFGQPVWHGNQEIAGKTLLIYADEGLGDAIQFARWHDDERTRAENVIPAGAAPTGSRDRVRCAS
jgi:hypothetical protein